jgi:hypothetical protein
MDWAFKNSSANRGHVSVMNLRLHLCFIVGVRKNTELSATHRRQLDTPSGHHLDFKWFDRRLANSESERIGVGPTGHPEPPTIPPASVHIGGPSSAPSRTRLA